MDPRTFSYIDFRGLRTRAFLFVCHFECLCLDPNSMHVGLRRACPAQTSEVVVGLRIVCLPLRVCTAFGMAQWHPEEWPEVDIAVERTLWVKPGWHKREHYGETWQQDDCTLLVVFRMTTTICQARSTTGTIGCTAICAPVARRLRSRLRSRQHQSGHGPRAPWRS